VTQTRLSGQLIRSSSVSASAIVGTVPSASFATTASFALNAGGSGFPFSGDAVITGSLLVSGSGLRVSGSTSIRVGSDTLTFGTVGGASTIDNNNGQTRVQGYIFGGSSGFSPGNDNTRNLGTTSLRWNTAYISTVIGNSLQISGSGLRVTGSADVLGNFTATTKSFKIPHQTQLGKSLVYGVLEGNEHAVYTRGVIKGSNIITLPDEWEWLVDPDTITVQLTPIGTHQKLYVKSIDHPHITIENGNMFSGDIHCYYLVHATRKDVAPLQTVV